jgi:single-stranded-DNA-specific exonuclease
MPQCYEWEFHTPDHGQRLELAEQLNVSPLTAEVLINRGFESAGAASRFLNPSLKDLTSPDNLQNLEGVLDRLVAALARGEHIGIYGDYDADGITATALLYDFFTDLGAPVSYYLPHRIKHGYGVHREIIDQMAAAGVDLIITVDCGITSHDGAGYARASGLDFIVVDHHQAPPELPPATGVINPQIQEGGDDFKELSGVGVSFFLLLGLRRRLRDEGWFQERSEPNLKKILPIVTLGTVADVVPLVRDNRILVHYGLMELNRSENPGIMALKKMVRLTKDGIRVWNVAFQLAPRINVAGRLGDPGRAVRLLTTRDHEEARGLARSLEEENNKRKALEGRILKEAEDQAAARPDFDRAKGFVLWGEGWHAGVIGIVAGRLAAAWSRPVLIAELEEGIAKGSARSIPGFDIFSCLEAGSRHLMNFGGHPAAAGFRLREEDLLPFSQFFETYLDTHLTAETTVRRLQVDGLAGADDLTVQQAEAFSRFEPFGQGNPEPVLALKDVEVLEVERVGAKHLRLNGRKEGQYFSMIAFDQAENKENMTDRMDLAFKMRTNDYQNHKTLDLRLRDFRPAG